MLALISASPSSFLHLSIGGVAAKLSTVTAVSGTLSGIVEIAMEVPRHIPGGKGVRMVLEAPANILSQPVIVFLAGERDHPSP